MQLVIMRHKLKEVQTMNVKIANKLYELRRNSGLSQEELADKIGVSRQAVSKWERAEASPDTDNLILLAKIYNVSLDDIISEEDVENAEKEERSENKSECECENDDDDDDDDDEDDDDDYKGMTKKQRIVVGSVTGSLYLLATIAFLLIGFLAHVWNPTWLVFFVPIIIDSLIRAIIKGNPSTFNYPVFVTAMFLLFGTLYGIWHPLWVIFLTIPAYYSIVGIFKRR